MQDFVQEKVLNRELTYVRKLKENGEIEDVAVYVSKMRPTDVLVAYLEQYVNKNNDTWSYISSPLYKLIKESIFGYSYIDGDGNVYYVRK